MIFSLAVIQKQRGVRRRYRLALILWRSEGIGLARLSRNRGRTLAELSLELCAKQRGSWWAHGVALLYTSTNAPRRQKAEVAVIWETNVNIGRRSISGTSR